MRWSALARAEKIVCWIHVTLHEPQLHVGLPGSPPHFFPKRRARWRSKLHYCSAAALLRAEQRDHPALGRPAKQSVRIDSFRLLPSTSSSLHSLISPHLRLIQRSRLHSLATLQLLRPTAQEFRIVSSVLLAAVIRMVWSPPVAPSSAKDKSR